MAMAQHVAVNALFPQARIADNLITTWRATGRIKMRGGAVSEREMHAIEKRFAGPNREHGAPQR